MNTFCNENSTIPQSVRYNIARKLPLDDLTRLCRVNKKCSKICNDDKFWRYKGRNEPFVNETKPSDMDFKEWYQVLAKNRVFEMDETTRLIFGAMNGYFKLIVYAVGHGADIQYNDNEALIQASNGGYSDIVRYLIDHGADITAGNDYALVSAIHRGDLNLVKYIVEKDRSIDVNDFITLASADGHLDILEFLVEKGAEVNFINGDDNTSLDVAVSNGNLEIVKYLIENGANTDTLANGEIRISLNLDSIYEAVFRGYVDIIEYLVNHGLVLDINDKDLFTSAVQSGNVDMVKYLVEYGFDVNNNDAFRWAIRNNSRDIVDYLIENGVKPNYRLSRLGL